MLFSKGYQLHIEIKIHHFSRWIGGKVNHQHLRFRPCIFDSLLHLLKVVDVRAHGQVTDISSCNDESVWMNWISRVGRKNQITRRCDRHSQMCQTLFGADGRNGFRLGIKINIELLFIPCTDGFAQAGNTL